MIRITKNRIWVTSLVLIAAALAWAYWRAGFSAPGRIDAISDLECTPDGSRIVTGHKAAIDVWDVASHRLLLRIPQPEEHFDITLSPDSRLIGVAQGYEVSVFGLDDGHVMQVFPVPRPAPRVRTGYDSLSYISGLAFGSDGATLLLGVALFKQTDNYPDAGKLCRFDLSENKSVLRSTIELPDAPETVRLYPNGKFAVVVGWNMMAVIVDLENNQIRHDITQTSWEDGSGATLFAVDVSPNGQLLAIGDTPGLRIVNAETAEDVHEIPKPDSTSYGPLRVRFSPDGAFLAVAWALPTPCTIYDTRTWRVHSEFPCNWKSIAWIPKRPRSTFVYCPGGRLQVVAFDQPAE